MPTKKRKKRNPSFSLRSWANNLGLEGHAPLHLMIKGSRHIPRKYIPHFIKTLALAGNKGLYFETLVEFERAKSNEQNDFYYRRMTDISPREPVKIQELETFKYLEDPLHAILVEMSDLKGFKRSPLSIQKRLNFKTSIQQIESAITRLIELGLLVEGPGKTLTKGKDFVTTKQDFYDRGVQKYHQNVAALGIEAVSTQPLTEREFGAYALNIKKSELPRIKQAIRNTLVSLIEKIEAKPGQGDETYQLNLQFFANTNNKGENP